MQLNITKSCNLACEHCHLAASPARNEMMTREVMEAALAVFVREGFTVLDITGGEPELNPDYAWLLRAGARVAGKVITRTNLAILTEPAYQHLPQLWADLRVVVMGSMPCYTQENVDVQKGRGTYEKDIAALQALNAVGYACDENLVLNLVSNPLGAYLPGAQDALEVDYRRELRKCWGVKFNQVLTLTNNPVGRFAALLEREGRLDAYQRLLVDNFNPATLPGMMCRDQISVDCDGTLYDCDFNLAQKRGLLNREVSNIFEAQSCGLPSLRAIAFANHCYACTAGAGSSCQGTTV